MKNKIPDFFKEVGDLRVAIITNKIELLYRLKLRITNYELFNLAHLNRINRYLPKLQLECDRANLTDLKYL